MVVVQVDYGAVSHAIGIVGVTVIYQISNFGGARIATVTGLLSSGSKKGNWWIPSTTPLSNNDLQILKNGIHWLQQLQSAVSASLAASVTMTLSAKSVKFVLMTLFV